MTTSPQAPILHCSPEAFVASARKYLGVPFRHRGRSPKGMDCAGLLIVAARDIGLAPFDVENYGREPAKDGLRENMVRNLGDPVEGGIANGRPGDLVLMKFVSEPHHVGVLGDYPLGGLSLIHSYGDVGRVVEHRLDEVWAGRVLEVYRFGFLPSVDGPVTVDGVSA